jgi:hypothetical protein
VPDGEGEGVTRVLDAEGGEAFAGAVEVAGGVGAGGVDVAAVAVAQPAEAFVGEAVQDPAGLRRVRRFRGEAA